MIDIFISHSSQDTPVAAQLVDLLRSALNLRADQVRCTSIDGYRLPAGADSDEQLRDEALNAGVFIGVLSPFSLASAYVLFELGARWGAKRPILPLLAGGLTAQALRGPLVGLNALSSASASQLHQLVGEIAQSLQIKAEAPAVYQRHVDGLVTLQTALPTDEYRAGADLAPAVATATEPHKLQSLPRRSVNAYDNAEQIIRTHCEREWPDDFEMQNHCIQKQNAAVERLRKGAPPDIPAEVFEMIRWKCAGEWTDDFEMRHHCEGKQIAGYRQLQRRE